MSSRGSSLKKKGFTHESQAAETTSWYTPKWVFDKLGLEFDLDPCAPQGGVPWIPAKNHYSLPQDGLSLPWSGRVWCNPPYGKETPKWLDKMAQHRDGVALVFARTDVKWFHDFVATSDAVLFLKGRIQFVDGLGLTGSSGSSCGSLLVAWGSDSVDALLRMADSGDGFVVVNNANK